MIVTAVMFPTKLNRAGAFNMARKLNAYTMGTLYTSVATSEHIYSVGLDATGYYVTVTGVASSVEALRAEATTALVPLLLDLLSNGECL